MGTVGGTEAGYADLHIHTIFSDGTFTPQEVVRRAKEAALRTIAITDHDSVNGIEEGMRAGKELGIEVLPGFELSAWVGGDEIHVLGYLIDHKDKQLLVILKNIREFRKRRAREIILKLRKLGIYLDMGEVLEEAGLGAVGRPHIAEVLVKRGYAQYYEEAFQRFIGDGCPAWVPKLRTPPKQVFSMIKRAGGVPVFAHPGLEGKDNLIPRLVEEGLEGIEVWYGREDEGTVRHYQQIAHRYDLLMTGGSDCHGTRRGDPLLGKVKLPYSVVERLKKHKSERVMG